MDLILTVNLKGNIEGMVQSVHKQTSTVSYFKEDGKVGTMTRKILHTDRRETPCSRVTRISGSAVNSWRSNECPFWEKPFKWKNMSKTQRIKAHVDRFDENHGVTFEFVGEE